MFTFDVVHDGKNLLAQVCGSKDRQANYCFRNTQNADPHSGWFSLGKSLLNRK